MIYTDFYHGNHKLRGSGLGSFFSSLFRNAIPILKDSVKYLAKKGLRAGVGTLDDIIDGQSPKIALKHRLRYMKDDIISDARRKMHGGKKRIKARKSVKRLSGSNKKQKKKIKKISIRKGVVRGRGRSSAVNKKQNNNNNIKRSCPLKRKRKCKGNQVVVKRSLLY